MLVLLVSGFGFMPKKVWAFQIRTSHPGVQGVYYDTDNPWPFKGANCTWYAFGRIYEINGVRPNVIMGHAKDWWENNIKLQKEGQGYPYGQEPRVGAIACWKPKKGEKVYIYGHVAVVEKVENGRVIISESIYKDSKTYDQYQKYLIYSTFSNNYKANYDSLYDFQGYIYATPLSKTTNITGTDDIKEGEYMIVSKVGKERVVEINKNTGGDGANVRLGRKSDRKHKVWKLIKNKDGSFRIVSKYREKAMDVSNGSKKNKANIHSWEYKNLDWQKWYIIKSEEEGWYNIVSKYSGLYMDVKNGSSTPGANIWQYTKNGTNAQKFKFEPYREEKKPFLNVITENIQDFVEEQHNDVREDDRDRNRREDLKITENLNTSDHSYLGQDAGDIISEEEISNYIPDYNQAQEYEEGTVSEGEYIICSELNLNRVVEVDPDNSANGANVRLGNYGMDSHKRWRITNVGGNRYKVLNVLTGKALDVEGEFQNDEANIHSWDYVNGTNQKWYLSDNGGGSYNFIAVHSGKMMDVKWAYDTVGNNIWQFGRNGSKAQLFKLKKIR